MPVWTAALPLVLPLLSEVVKCVGDKRVENAEKRREILEAEAKKMQTNLDSYRRLHEQIVKEKEEVVSKHNETMLKREQEYVEREKRLSDNVAKTQADFAKKTQEMQTASKEERERMRLAYREQIKTREDALNKARLEARRERDAERKAFEIRQREMTVYERNLHDCMLKQEKHHVEVIRLLLEKHSEKVEQLQERIVEQQKEHGVVVQGMHEQRLEDEKTNRGREAALIVAHYEEIRHVSLADNIHAVRTNFSLVERKHAQLIEDIRTAIDNSQEINTGLVKRTMSDLDTSLAQLSSAEDSLLSALDKASSVPLTARSEIREFIKALATRRQEYSACARLVSGGLIRRPNDVLPVEVVEEVERLFAQLSVDVKNIPMLELNFCDHSFSASFDKYVKSR
ncbi:hypothetical protein PRIPAC_94758 [Pristionchus pacificus]|uniref:Uncharacterized protein n=1 Tax=Pristionchus pacificus TaxID=54126 RepID=A0A2A6BP66_PRIPA|nr:hypothetical protein PRIPAC_94758 [Pristionchus pacificus]|eukprot:PDM67715.1 hypothetical protein PRIPAC_45759 [Pristionchus pacificus]